MLPEPATLLRQRALAALILEPEPPPETLGSHRDPLLAYRELVRSSLLDPLETMFPVTMALLESEGVWAELVDGFLAARCVPSHHHRDIAPAFLGWLAEHRPDPERWPFLLELVHWELLETLVDRFEDLPAEPGLAPEPAIAATVVLDPAAQLVSYTHRVHLASPEQPWPAPGATHLLAYRDRQGGFRLRELTPAAAVLLAWAATQPLGEVLAALGIADPAGSFALLEELRDGGAVAGFRVT